MLCAAFGLRPVVMRLTKLKLAGFKSFVDPTTIALPGQLVGVVGPNGCGKSNVIDAVRWVLGESKASELRGESMQDVIFNGSSSRKAVSRAAVELTFDNSLGRIAGQWSQYAELSVKRQLTRSGQSAYYINNLQVRRKDITDLFLGTGLGPRAYAIIGQGTISRIIEARPDELRVFLEEAAGVTKYKERRKETQGRIADTRENLLRVEDIRAELGGQIERLAVQATVARQYREYQHELTQKQHLLWFLRKIEAGATRERLTLDLGRLAAELEGQTAALRQTEARLEAARQAHFASNDQLHQAQSELFSANAEVAQLEADLRHRRAAQQEYATRLAQLTDDQTHWQAEARRLNETSTRWQDLQTLADERVEQADMRLCAQQERLPLAEDAHSKAQATINAQRSELAQRNQGLQVEMSNQGHVQRSLQIIISRRQRLIAERGALPEPDLSAFEHQQAELCALREKINAGQAALLTHEKNLPQLEEQRRACLSAMQQVHKERSEAAAKRAALTQLQQRLQGDGKLDDWLQRHQLTSSTPLWQHLQVDAPWEDAVEAVLRERLSALSLHPLSEPNDCAWASWASDRPGQKLSLLLPLLALSDAVTDAVSAQAPNAAPNTVPSLYQHMRCAEPRFAAILQEWLSQVFTAPDLSSALAQRATLVGAACYVTPSGDIVHRQSVTLFAPNAAEHGLLERQREIAALTELISELDAQFAQKQTHLADIETHASAAQAALHDARHQLNAWQERAHAIEVDTLKLTQAIERFHERQAQIDQSLAEMLTEEEAETERLLIIDELIDVQREKIAQWQQTMDETSARFESSERALRDERERVGAAERDLREAQFAQRECVSQIETTARNEQLALQQVARMNDELTRCVDHAAAIAAEDLEPRLQAALEQRVLCEQALASMRNALEAAAANLRQLEEARMRTEQGHDPLREKISELKLKEQAAQLNYEQLATQLLEAKADEQQLSNELNQAKSPPKVAALQASMTHLQRAIEALGAVNLAALEELESATERKGFLDAQADDLTQAMETLENAIRRIDRETRDLLHSTYDAVNQNFGELFPILFGGGEARLMMTGDEILDSGVQVMAQPPGKKNSTIHLLSGGEKALTAIALVFAMFQLNPAPFCLLDEVDAPLDDTNTERFAAMVRRMSANTQFLFISHNKIAMEMAQQLVGVTMQESGVSRIVDVDMAEALRLREQIV